MVLITSSGGVPRSSVIIENWLTSVKIERDISVRRPEKFSSLLAPEAWLTILSREQWLALQHLGKDTADTPDIHYREGATRIRKKSTNKTSLPQLSRASYLQRRISAKSTWFLGHGSTGLIRSQSSEDPEFSPIQNRRSTRNNLLAWWPALREKGTVDMIKWLNVPWDRSSRSQECCLVSTTEEYNKFSIPCTIEDQSGQSCIAYQVAMDNSSRMHVFETALLDKQQKDN